MSCASFDIKEYVLGESPASERPRLEEHLRACAACAEEAERLRLATVALLSVRDEEPLRRIAFVSDKVFEPRWYRRFWASLPRLGFVSAALLALAIFSHSPIFRPAPAPAESLPVAQSPDATAMEARIQAELDRRLQAAIRQVVAQVEARQQRRTAELVRAAEERLAREHRADMLAAEENYNVLFKRMNILLTASADLGSSQ
jgi:anti-sigma factor RsiW